ncbi:putative histidine kinase 1-like [Capsicum annuum]|nr:putative histidine kinase 1-like [Capsicum annuum]KAF3678389.1 putative histidine kinase 1-like [Capsicum annuum]
MGNLEGASFSETPTYAVATVVTVLVSIGFLIHGSLKKFGKWLHKTKREPLYAALEKIKEELMVFGLLSLLMGHWIIYVAKICVKASAVSSHFYPCSPPRNKTESAITRFVLSGSSYSNFSISRLLLSSGHVNYCPEGLQSFASKESLEQLHRFLLVLGVSHVSYSFFAIALAMIKDLKNRWQTTREWGVYQLLLFTTPLTRGANTELLFGCRQFWSSINEADYMALRLGFITTHQLPLTYDFHKYMLRSMEEEFRDIVGIRITCSHISDFSNNGYWKLILLVGTKLHRVVVKLAVEIMDSSPLEGFHQFNLRDELFWFGKPRVISQFWCSFVTFPLYVIVAQMGSRYKKTIVSENVRTSLHGWRHKVKARLEGSVVSPETLLAATSLDSMEEDEADQIHTIVSDQHVTLEQSCTNEISECDELHIPLSPRI